jgi:hypothetical protein
VPAAAAVPAAPATGAQAAGFFPEPAEAEEVVPAEGQAPTGEGGAA